MCISFRFFDSLEWIEMKRKPIRFHIIPTITTFDTYMASRPYTHTRFFMSLSFRWPILHRIVPRNQAINIRKNRTKNESDENRTLKNDYLNQVMKRRKRWWWRKANDTKTESTVDYDCCYARVQNILSTIAKGSIQNVVDFFYFKVLCASFDTLFFFVFFGSNFFPF